MAENMRSCSKTACRWPAATSLSYRYGTSQVWLLDLTDQGDPSTYDLCPHHADMLVVPLGWELVDQRNPVEPVVEPSGAELAAPDREPVGPAGYGGSRYEALRQDLPRVARELAERSEHDWTHAPPMVAERRAAERDLAAPLPVPTRDLAPLPSEPDPGPAPGRHGRTPGPDGHEHPHQVEMTSPGPEDATVETSPGPADATVETSPGPAAAADPDASRKEAAPWHRREAPEVPGQLAIPVAAEDIEIGRAVVVSISGARRRQPAGHTQAD